MNYDRLLTRVWDKQEKKMLYSAVADYIGIGNDCFVTTNRGDIIVTVFKDRYVPMMCTGKSDKNISLIYEHDLLKNSNNDIFMVVYRNLELDLIPVNINYLDSQLKIKPVFEMLNCFEMQLAKIIGNRWENEKLMEVKV